MKKEYNFYHQVNYNVLNIVQSFHTDINFPYKKSRLSPALHQLRKTRRYENIRTAYEQIAEALFIKNHHE